MRIFNSIISCLLIICFVGCVDTVDGNLSGSDAVSDTQETAPAPDAGTDIETATPDTSDASTEADSKKDAAVVDPETGDASTEADSKKDVAVVDPETGDSAAGDGSEAEE